MLREIRGVVQRDLARRKRWFQDDFFDLYFWQDPGGEVLEMQLCYDRTGRERALVWKRGAGTTHAQVDTGETTASRRDTPLLQRGGKFGGWQVRERLAAGAAGLEPRLAAFVLDKVREYCDPPRRFRRPGRSTPDWLRRLRRLRRL